MQLSSRRSYLKGKLEESQLPENPFSLLEKWMDELRNAELKDFNAMTLSTVDLNGHPDARIVLLREVDGNNLVFFTSYSSPKASQILHQNNVVCSFYWSDFERAVRMKGVCEKLIKDQSVEYFNNRPKGSKLAALLSNQSEELENREILEKRFKELEVKYSTGQIEKPEDWGGYLVKVHQIEFFQGREHRLNDRILYRLKGENWEKLRLAP